MYIIRSIFLLLFVIILKNGVTQPALKITNCPITLKEKICKQKDQKVFSNTNNSKYRISKRKPRPRGIEVDTFYITNLSLKEYFVFSDFTQKRLEDIYSSFLYCVENKRGPPVV